jgi:predicted dienelactone hydrolase
VAAGPFPIVLLSHGWQGTRSEYTSLAEDLASYGYAVFGIDHPYMGWIALPSGQVTEATEKQFRNPAEIMEYYGQDLRFALEQIAKLNSSDRDNVFVKRLDLSRIAAIAHSSGFSAVSTACRQDRRIKACINIDAPGFKSELLTGVQQPRFGSNAPVQFQRIS